MRVAVSCRSVADSLVLLKAIIFSEKSNHFSTPNKNFRVQRGETPRPLMAAMELMVAPMARIVASMARMVAAMAR